MRRALIVVSLAAFLLTGCGVKMASMSLSWDQDTIEWDGRTYYAFGSPPPIMINPLMGRQIGIANNMDVDRIYTVKGYSSEEWIIEQLNGDMNDAVLYKEKSVTDIPTELAACSSKDKYETCTQIVNNDGRTIKTDSGLMHGWKFRIFDKNKQLSNVDLRDFAEINSDVLPSDTSVGNLLNLYFGIDISQYLAPYNIVTEIYVWTFDTVPMDSDSPDKTYVFVFNNPNELLYYKQLDNNEQFETIQNVCNQLIENDWDAWVN